MPDDLALAAARILPLVDLTTLRDDDTDAVVTALCGKATTPRGAVAAVCVFPRFVPTARRALAGRLLRVATVANFPPGDDDASRAADETRRAVEAGADEVDVVFPWRAFLDGARGHGEALVAACRAAAGARTLKVILESGAFRDPTVLAAAAREAVAGGADFLKTSTGRREPGATPEAARALLEVAAAARGRDVGLKVSGGVRTTAQAAAYLALADATLGRAWVGPRHLRFGASALLDDLLAVAARGSTP